MLSEGFVEAFETLAEVVERVVEDKKRGRAETGAPPKCFAYSGWGRGFSSGAE